MVLMLQRHTDDEAEEPAAKQIEHHGDTSIVRVALRQ